MSARTLVLPLFGLFVCSGRLPVLAGDVPLITFAYSQILDDACAELARQPLDPQAAEETRRFLPGLETEWRQEGPAWLRATKEAVGQPFTFREARAALITCGLPSMSHPLLINIKPHVRGGALGIAVEARRVVGAVFHELLHRYVSDIVTPRAEGSTPLLRKYASEHPVVRNHLHLFAIREAVYARRERRAELKAVESFEASSPRAKHFTRARDIVQAEGIDRLLEELRPRRVGP